MYYGVEVHQWDTSGYEAPDYCGKCPDYWECGNCAVGPQGLPTLFVVEVADWVDRWECAAMDAMTARTGWRARRATVYPLR